MKGTKTEFKALVKETKDNMELLTKVFYNLDKQDYDSIKTAYDIISLIADNQRTGYITRYKNFVSTLSDSSFMKSEKLLTYKEFKEIYLYNLADYINKSHITEQEYYSYHKHEIRELYEFYQTYFMYNFCNKWKRENNKTKR